MIRKPNTMGCHCPTCQQFDRARARHHAGLVMKICFGMILAILLLATCCRHAGLADAAAHEYARSRPMPVEWR